MLLSHKQIIRLFQLKMSGHGYEDVIVKMRLKGSAIRAEAKQVYLHGVIRNEHGTWNDATDTKEDRRDGCLSGYGRGGEIMTPTDKAQELLGDIAAEFRKAMGPSEEWDEHSRNVFYKAEELSDIIRSMDIRTRLNRIEDALEETNPGINLR